MSDETHADRRRPPGSLPLPPRELKARRAALRRRRGMRRAGLVAVVAIAAALAIVIDSGGRQHRQAHAQAQTQASTGGRAGRARASNFPWELRADRRVLSYTSYIRAGTRRHREVALTF